VRVLSASVAGLDDAAALLAEGHVVAVPTDTVYGLAARLEDPAAIDALFAAKHRPATVPVAVLCATTADAVGVASRWPSAAVRLASRYWPGPLTVVVEAPRALVDRLGASVGVGLRVPDDATCCALLARTGPLAVTSANLHGAAPATTAAQVAHLEGVAAVVDDGPRVGAVSSVVDVTGERPTVVREGAVRAAELLDLLSAG
jgi:L-threonylcarbamoyladenylate synthase